MSYVITIGREYGSGGRFIAKKLAETLNIKFYDNEIITQAAVESGISKDVLDNFDEKKDSFIAGFAPFSVSVDIPMGQKVFVAQFNIIEKLGQGESCVIVGRCADYILKNNPNLIKVFINAPMEDKIQRAIKYYGIDENKAKETVIKVNKKRASYYNFYTDRKWGYANNYDLCINSSIGIDESCEIIKNYVEKRVSKM